MRTHIDDLTMGGMRLQQLQVIMSVIEYAPHYFDFQPDRADLAIWSYGPDKQDIQVVLECFGPDRTYKPLCFYADEWGRTYVVDREGNRQDKFFIELIENWAYEW